MSLEGQLMGEVIVYRDFKGYIIVHYQPKV